jgi:hypothetical protein
MGAIVPHPVALPAPKPRANLLRFFAAPGARSSYHGSHRPERGATAATKATASKEDFMKELSHEEVLRIAGGVPLSAALDEITYRAHEEQAFEAVDYARLFDKDLHASETP